MISFLPVPLLDSTLDYTILSFAAVLLLLSLLSLCFIFYLRFKSRTLHHLQDFNVLWSVRFILVFLIIFWALNELLRISFFRHHIIISLFSTVTESNQANLCKIQAILSLGFFEPAFLVTLLFIVNTSIKKKTPNDIWAIPFVITTCLPVLLFQTIFVFFPPSEIGLPAVFTRSYLISENAFGSQLFCVYPLLSTIVFGAFAIGYCLCFLFSCWKAVAVVINKGLRVRIYGLSLTVLISLPVQILCLGLSVLWKPEEPAHDAMVFIVFVSTSLCAAVGEGILVIRPIADSLAAGKDFCRWTPVGRSPQQEGGQGPEGRGFV